MSWNKIKRKLIENKEGFFYGAIVGFLFWLVVKTIGIDLTFMQFGIIDYFKPAYYSLQDFASTKLLIASIIVGSLLGAAIDNILPEHWIRRYFR